MDDDTAEALKTAIVDFKKGFFGEGDNLLVGAGHEEYAPIDEDQVDQEKNRQAEALVSLAGTAGTPAGSGSPGHRDLRKG